MSCILIQSHSKVRGLNYRNFFHSLNYRNPISLPSGEKRANDSQIIQTGKRVRQVRGNRINHEGTLDSKKSRDNPFGAYELAKYRAEMISVLDPSGRDATDIGASVVSLVSITTSKLEINPKLRSAAIRGNFENPLLSICICDMLRGERAGRGSVIKIGFSSILV